MEVEIQNSKKDYIAFCRHSYFFNKRFAILMFLISVMFYDAFSTSDGAGKQILLFIVVVLVVVIIRYVLYVAKLNKSLAERISPFERKKIKLREDGIYVESESDNNFWRYDAIKKVDMNRDSVYIILFNAKLYLLPKRNFPSESDAVNFFGYIRNKVLRGRDKPGNDYMKKKKLYYLSFLGLAPGIGTAVGAILLYTGIVRYKDKLLIIAGIAVIIFQAIACGALFKGQSFSQKDQLVYETQRELKDIVKDVEFYKVQNGFYPDSLAQLGSKTDPVFFFDPYNSHGNNLNGGCYYYKKIGNKYALYSVGVDGIPHTKDDIYPNLIIRDSSKYGLIKDTAP